jgi:hypothetical protein
MYNFLCHHSPMSILTLASPPLLHYLAYPYALLVWIIIR